MNPGSYSAAGGQKLINNFKTIHTMGKIRVLLINQFRLSVLEIIVLIWLQNNNLRKPQ